jgi:hypothetical protein
MNNLKEEILKGLEKEYKNNKYKNYDKGTLPAVMVDQVNKWFEGVFSDSIDKVIQAQKEQDKKEFREMIKSCPIEETGPHIKAMVRDVVTSYNIGAKNGHRNAMSKIKSWQKELLNKLK